QLTPCYKFLTPPPAATSAEVAAFCTMSTASACGASPQQILGYRIIRCGQRGLSFFEFLNPIQRRKHRANPLDNYICVRRSDRERTTARGERLQQRGGRAGHNREGEERTQVGSAEFHPAAST